MTITLERGIFGLAPDQSYRSLSDRFFEPADLSPAPAPRLVVLNDGLVEKLGLDRAWLTGPKGIAWLSGSSPLPGLAPIALAYAGHQFGQFVPVLGDGRALLLGEFLDLQGRRFDVALKGSGRTAFSRRGDGRAALGPMLREHIVSEAMAALGIPTTRSLAVLATGEPVIRDRVLPGAILVRIADSHIRVGTFEYFAVRGDRDALDRLAEHVRLRHFPEATDNRELLGAIIARQAKLVAQWMGVGFVHGVMNTDNIAVSGQTLDYGPCAFLDEYEPGATFSSIDQNGRYAYANQPRMAQWGLARLAEAMLPLLDKDRTQAVAAAQASIDAFPAQFDSAYLQVLRRKLGLKGEHAADGELAGGFLTLLAQNRMDFTLSYRALSDIASGLTTQWTTLLQEASGFAEWAAAWQRRLEDGSSRPGETAVRLDAANPLFIPRNHLVEQALDAAVERGDLAPFDELLKAITQPFVTGDAAARLALPPEPSERIEATFCGT